MEKYLKKMRKNRIILLKNMRKKRCRAYSFNLKSNGERGIRTLGTLQYNGFQDRRIRPLCHLSGNFFQKKCYEMSEKLPLVSNFKMRLQKKRDF